MNLTSLRDRVSVSAAWVAMQVAARPKVALMVWIASLALAAWVF